MVSMPVNKRFLAQDRQAEICFEEGEPVKLFLNRSAMVC